jgi:hypothetical protein
VLNCDTANGELNGDTGDGELNCDTGDSELKCDTENGELNDDTENDVKASSRSFKLFIGLWLEVKSNLPVHILSVMFCDECRISSVRFTILLLLTFVSHELASGTLICSSKFSLILPFCNFSEKNTHRIVLKVLLITLIHLISFNRIVLKVWLIMLIHLVSFKQIQRKIYI